MITFIIPLQSREASKSWTHVKALFFRTYQSVINQTNAGFKVVVVCNESPFTQEPEFPQVKVVVDEFKIPETPEERMLDKWKKVHRALVEIAHEFTDYVMVVDADDLITNKIAEFVNQERLNPSGWLVDKGYIFDEGLNQLYTRSLLSKICGTSSIIRLHQADLPITKEEECHHFMLSHGHTKIDEYFEKLGAPMEILPFRGVIYMTGTSENHTGIEVSRLRSGRTMLKWLFKRVALTKKIREEFNLLSL